MDINTTQQEEDGKTSPAALPNQIRGTQSPNKWTRGRSGPFLSLPGCSVLHLPKSSRPLANGTDFFPHPPALWVCFLEAQRTFVVSERSWYTWGRHRGQPKTENVTKHKSFSFSGTFLAWISQPCQLHFLLKQRFRETLFHLNIRGSPLHPRPQGFQDSNMKKCKEATATALWEKFSSKEATCLSQTTDTKLWDWNAFCEGGRRQFSS